MQVMRAFRRLSHAVLIALCAILLLAGCTGPGPLPPTETPVPPTPTPRPTATTVPTATATPRPTAPPTPLPGTRASTAASGNIALPTPNPTPRPPATATPPRPGGMTAPMMTPPGPLGPAYRLLFASNRDGSDDLFTIDPDGYRLVNLTKAQKMKGRDSDPQWSPDGAKIAFVSDRDGGPDIWVMNADGSGAKNLTRGGGGEELGPRWSPDSKRIAYTAYRDGDTDIYAVNADGGEPQRLTNSPGDDVQPAWSPDGTLIAFASARGNKPRGLYTLKVNDPVSVAAVVGPPCDVASPAWSPDSKTLAVVACVGADGKGPMNSDIRAVYTVPAAGGMLAALSDGKQDSGAPAWSPDSGSLAFFSYRTAQQADVIVVTLGSGARRMVTAPPGAARDIAWSPDSAALAFIGGEFAAGQLVVVDMGGTVRPFANGGANDRQPRWSPKQIP